jgi:hypothetical protein
MPVVPCLRPCVTPPQRLLRRRLLLPRCRSYSHTLRRSRRRRPLTSITMRTLVTEVRLAQQSELG